MNKLILLFVFLLHYSFLQAQTSYAPMGATWRSFNVNYRESEYFWHRYEKDTLVEDHICSKIGGYIVKALTSSMRDTLSNSIDYVYTNSDTIFYFNEYYHRFLPLYILNVHAGDVVKYHVPYPAGSDTLFDVEITSVDTVYVSGKPLRRYTAAPASGMSYFEIPVFIERIGPVYATSPVIPTPFVRPSDSQPYLRCYNDADIDSNFRFAGVMDCDYAKPLSVETLVDETSFTVYPNPARETIHIDFPQITSGELIISSISGVRILRRELVSAAKAISVSVAGYPSGTYHVRLVGEGFVQNKILTLLP